MIKKEKMGYMDYETVEVYEDELDDWLNGCREVEDDFDPFPGKSCLKIIVKKRDLFS